MTTSSSRNLASTVGNIDTLEANGYFPKNVQVISEKNGDENKKVISRNARFSHEEIPEMLKKFSVIY